MTPDRAAFEAALKSLRQRSGTSQDVQIVRMAHDALRAELDELKIQLEQAIVLGQGVISLGIERTAERDAAVADAEGFRNGQLQVQASFDSLWSDASALRAEVAALTADNERLRAVVADLRNDLIAWFTSYYDMDAEPETMPLGAQNTQKLIHDCAALAPRETP